ncbi:MAG: PAS domain-containing sensor histidine kinase, partial [Candidatus Cloacimonetes bacterium]|nr:PAS domain-containing sensor histidine kinase [Candidatus Cloacimonadota bacterium]
LTPESSTHFKKILPKIITEGIISGIELEMLNKDGKKILISFSGKIIKGVTTEFEHIHCILQDITEQKDAEQALNESKKQLQNIYDNINIGYFRSKPDGKILVANPALLKMLGYDSFQELADRNLEEKNMIIDPSQSEFNKITKEKGEVIGFEAKLRKNDGSRIYVYESIKAIKDKKDEIHYYEGTIEDITNRKKTEYEIQLQQEHIDLINKIIMHDLTKHLIVINNTINNYRKSQEEEYLDESIKRIKRNLKLLNKMRELELFVSSEREHDPINVERIFKEIKNNYKAITFNITGSATILADKYLFSVFDHIIRNAVVHGSASKIDIEINNKRNFCEIRIGDDGVGISDEMKKQICEEGFKFGKKGHTGLGLFIVKKAMESYEGSIQVVDNEPDGAIFILTFKNVN